MRVGTTLFAATALAMLCPIAVRAQSAAAVMDEGLSRSQVMASAHELADRIGPRLTGSRNMGIAEQWALAKMRSAGLADARLEKWPFGMGWDLLGWSATMVSPRRVQMVSIPKAWTAGTAGVVRGPVVLAPIKSAGDVAAFAGRLRGKVVMVSAPAKTSEPAGPAFRRLTDEDIAKRDRFELPEDHRAELAESLETYASQERINDLLAAEGALAILRQSYADAGLVHGEAYEYRPGRSPKLAEFEVGHEDYGRLARLAATGAAPVVELESRVRWSDAPVEGANVIGDIIGSDPRAGYVMAGAHFDSWIAGDGAADNGAGSVVVLEAARILKAIGARPKRTIRFALWEGEEQALLGSRAYIERHLATRPLAAGLGADAEYESWPLSFPVAKRPGYADLKAYFNVDNGSGRFRGLYAEQNIAAIPILEEWLAPYAALGANKVVMSRTGGTDHAYFQSVGLNGFQFVQDPLDYGSRVHHSQLDTYDHLRADDLRQAATVLAGVLLAAANDERELPRPPFPTAVRDADPFKW